jgi:hypothetical protein
MPRTALPLRRLVASTLVGVALAAGLSAAPVPTHIFPKDPPAFFPTAVGTKWVYQTADGDHTWVITRVEKEDGARVVTITDEVAGKETRTLKIAVSESGIRVLSGSHIFPLWRGELYCSQLLLNLPHAEGDSWDVTATLEGGFHLRGTWRVGGEERVKVPAGMCTATRVDWEPRLGRQFKVDLRTPCWYAKGIGLIQVGKDPSFWSLKSFELGRE